MFVERDTGPKNYFEVPLATAAEIFRTAYKRVSGLARTVRGPSMSATPGKVVVDGVAEVYGQKVFVLKFIQGREPDWVGRPFFARYDPEATWLDDLRPAFGQKRFFFEQVLRQIRKTGDAQAWGQRVPVRRRLKIFGDLDWEIDTAIVAVRETLSTRRAVVRSGGGADIRSCSPPARPRDQRPRRDLSSRA